MQVQDVMTRVVTTVGVDDTLAVAIARMLDGRVSGLPVVDGAGHVVGVLTEGDLLRRTETGTSHQASGWKAFFLGPTAKAVEYVASHSRRVADLMTREVVSVAEDAPLVEAVSLMEERRIKRLPVLRGSALVGIISRADLLRALRSALPAEVASQQSDDEIRRQLTAELEHQSWFPTAQVGIEVKNGIVTFSGIIYDDAIRPALRVAAQNTPGVKGVEDSLKFHLSFARG